MTKTRRGVLIACLLLMGAWAATQIAAHRMAYPPGLSGEVGRVGEGTLYAPWSVVA